MFFIHFQTWSIRIRLSSQHFRLSNTQNKSKQTKINQNTQNKLKLNQQNIIFQSFTANHVGLATALISPSLNSPPKARADSPKSVTFAKKIIIYNFILKFQFHFTLATTAAFGFKHDSKTFGVFKSRWINSTLWRYLMPAHTSLIVNKLKLKFKIEFSLDCTKQF